MAVLVRTQNTLVRVLSQVSDYIWPPGKKPYYPFLSRLSDTGRPLNELVAMVVGLAIGSSVNYAQGKREPFSCWVRLLVTRALLPPFFF